MNRVFKLFDVQPHERGVAGALFLLAFAIGIGRVFAITAAFPIFLSEWSPADLAFVYILASVGTVAVSVGYLRLGRALNPRRLIIANLGFALGVTALIRLALTLIGAKGPAMVLATWAFVLFVLTNLAFWAAAQRVVNIRQGKRIFPLATSGDVLAYAVGGVVAGQLAEVIGTPNLLIISALGVGVAAIGFVRLVRMRPERFQTVVSRPGTPARRKPVSWSSPYLRLMIVYFALSGAVFVFVDNAFNFVAKGRYPVEEDLAAFIGGYQAVTAIVNFLFRGFIAGRVIGRFGVVAGLAALPLAVLLGSTVVVVSGAAFGAAILVFWGITATKLGDKVFRGMTASSFATLYQPLLERGPSVQATMEGVVDAAAIGLAGFLLLILGKMAGFGAIELATVVVVFCIVWAVIARLLKREYVNVLGSALHRRRIGTEQIESVGADVIEVVRKELDSPVPENVVYALELLERSDPEALRAALPHLMSHSLEDVRINILHRIESHRVTSALPAVRMQWESESGSAALRGQAIRVLCALSEESIPLGVEALRHRERAVRMGALAGLLRSGSIEGIVYAGAELLRELESPDPRDRVFAATVLRDAGIASFYGQVRRLLEDPDVGVREMALEAAARLAHPQLWPLVVRALRDPTLGKKASEVLVGGGDAAVAALAREFPRYGRDRAFRLSAIRIMGLIRGEEAITHLWQHLGSRNRQERHAVMVALSNCALEAADERALRVQELLEEEAKDTVDVLAALTETVGDPRTAVLSRALRYEVELARHRVFLLLSYIYPEREPLTAWDNYASGDRDKRAYALELLENFLSLDLRAMFFPLLEDRDPADALGRVATRFLPRHRSREQWLREIVEAEQGRYRDWTVQCARHAAGALGLQPAAGEADGRLVDTVLRLKSVELFDEMPEHVLGGIVPRLREVTLEQGQPVFEAGDPGDSLYIIVEGSVRIHDGPVTLATLTADQVFGEFTVLQSAPRTASATPNEATRLWRFEQADLFDLVSNQVRIARTMIEMILRRLEENRAARERVPDDRRSRMSYSISLKPLE